MKHLSLSVKLYAVIGVLIASSIAISWIGLSKMTEIKMSLHQIVNGPATRLGNAYKLKELFLIQVINEKNLIAEVDVDNVPKRIKMLDDRHAQMLKHLKESMKVTSKEGAVNLNKFSDLYGKWWETEQKIMDLVKVKNNTEAFLISTTSGLEVRLRVEELMDEIVKRNQANMVNSAGKADANYEAARSSVIFLSVFSTLACSIIAYLVLRNVNISIDKVIMILTEGSTQVTVASQQIASSSEELSQSTTEQAASLEETASSIEELNSMVQRNAENARRTSQLAHESNSSAEKGKQVVAEMMTSISDIKESNHLIKTQIDRSNQQISDIVHVIAEISNKTQVINDIVFQTKLLSFNASVEAARAAEHGKGFAVVAEEVGNLAEMSGNAAREISTMLAESMIKVEAIVAETRERVTSLIEQGQVKIDSGTKIADECKKVLEEIVSNVSNVTQMAGDISIACSEQAQGVQEMTKAMNQLDQVTQMNSSTSEEVASSAEELAAQADSLRNGVQVLVQTVKGSDKLVKVQKESNVIPFRPKNAAAKKQAGTWISKKRPEANVPQEDDVRFEEA